jgi:electron transport complex protein RnfC
MTLFTRGITLKKQTKRPPQELMEIPLPQRVILPLRQYNGEPLQPTVAEGDAVRVGQVIATAPTNASLPLHATISGIVAAVTECPDYTGIPTPCIILEADGADTWIEHPPEETDLEQLEPSEILNRIHDAGLITKTLTPAPLSSDLVPRDQPASHLMDGTRITPKIDTLLITALDKEPALGVNRYLAGIHTDDLPRGLAVLKTITGAPYTRFVVDKNTSPYPQLTELVAADEEEATTITAVNGRRHPLGLTIPLIKAVLGREVPLPYGHPRDVGVAVYDLDTTMAIGRAVRTRLPQVESLITVGGGAVKQPGIITVRIGTPIREIIESLGGFATDPAKVILGGPMTGMAHYDLDTPVTKDTEGLFALTPDEVQRSGDYRQCINCGLCVKVCPVNLLPGILSLYCAQDKFDMAETNGLFACIECGCCDYVCPSRRPLVHLFRHAKYQVMEA